MDINCISEFPKFMSILKEDSFAFYHKKRFKGKLFGQDCPLDSLPLFSL